jgi:hypothetical protein
VQALVTAQNVLVDCVEHTKTFRVPISAQFRFYLCRTNFCCLAGLPAFDFQTEPLVMVVAGISGEPFFAAKAFAATVFVFHTKHQPCPYADTIKKLNFVSSLKNWNRNAC